MSQKTMFDTRKALRTKDFPGIEHFYGVFVEFTENKIGRSSG